jgi:hypothetical protein
VDDLHVVALGECVDVRADGTANSSPVLRAASGIVSATAAARSLGIAANSRRQKRPNAPHPSSPTPSFAPGIIGFERHDASFSVDAFMVLEHYAPSARASSWILLKHTRSLSASPWPAQQHYAHISTHLEPTGDYVMVAGAR